MKQIIILSVAALLFVSSISTTLIFFNLWNKEKEHSKELDSKIEQLSTKLQKSKENNENLKITGEEFIQTMFSYNNETFKKAQNDVLKLTIGKAKEKLKQSSQPTQEDEITTEIAYSSAVQIKESSFNRIDEDSALINVKFDHTLTINDQPTSTPYQSKVWIIFAEGKWYVENYELEQLL